MPRSRFRLFSRAAVALLAFVAFLGSAPGRASSAASQAGAAPVQLRSPRLAALRERQMAGEADAFPAFWSALEKEGAPLVEPLPEDPDQRLVTFVYRGGASTRGVLILGSVAGRAPMEHLPGTDLWFKSVPVPKDARFTYRFAPETAAKGGVAMLDPLNRRPYPAAEPLLSLVELPDAPPQPWLASRPGTPQGRVERASLRSAILREERPLWLYMPPGYDPKGEPYPLLLVLDGSAYLQLIELPHLLDNLIAAGKLPPLVALLEGRLEADSRDTTLACLPAYARYLTEELLPWAGRRLRLTSDPARTVIAGSSLGGLAAACAAVAHPGRFGNVLAQSGAFWWKPDTAPDFEALTRQLRATPLLALRFYLDVGTLEVWPAKETGPSLLEANRHLRAVLVDKGYPVRYLELSGGHGYANWQATLPEGLIELLAPR